MKKYKTITGDDGEKYIVPDAEINIADSLPDSVCIVNLKKDEPAPNTENIEVVTGGEDNLCEAMKLKVRELEVPARVVPEKPVYHLPEDDIRRPNIVKGFLVADIYFYIFAVASIGVVIGVISGCCGFWTEKTLISVIFGCLSLAVLTCWVLMFFTQTLRFYGVNKYTKAYICHNKEIYKVSFKKVIDPGTNFNATKFSLSEAPGQSLFYNIEVERYGKDIFFSEQDAYAYIKYLNDTEEYNEAYNYSQLDEFYPEWQEDSVFKNFLRDRYQFKNSLFNVKDILKKYIKYQEELLKEKKEDFNKEIKQNLDAIRKYSLGLQDYINKN